jgi:hypothetical protein
VDALQVSEPKLLVGALREALRGSRPAVVEVLTSRSADDWSDGWHIAPPR